MAHEVQCRLCKVRFDTEKEPFILIGKKSYYHQACYDAWIKDRNNATAAPKDENFWYESVIDYLYRDVKMIMNFSKIESQWKHFTKPERKMTPKGIYFALRYYYEVQHGDKEKALGGIGIVANIYSDSARYWTELESRKAGTIDAIIEQIKNRENRETISIVRHERKQNKSKFSLDDI
jgi:hypothetical protein